jgi:hypothetical protein
MIGRPSAERFPSTSSALDASLRGGAAAAARAFADSTAGAADWNDPATSGTRPRACRTGTCVWYGKRCVVVTALSGSSRWRRSW